MAKDWEVDPVIGALIHVDLFRVAMDVRMRVKVPVHPVGGAQGVKIQGGIFEIVTREIEIECLPTDIPEEFKVDVSELLIGKQIRASDVPLDPAKLKLLTDPQRVLFHVVTLKAEVEATPEAAAAATEVAPAEPEVIKKGKKEVEEGEEGAPEAKAEKPEKPEKKGKEEVGAGVHHRPGVALGFTVLVSARVLPAGFVFRCFGCPILRAFCEGWGFSAPLLLLVFGFAFRFCFGLGAPCAGFVRGAFRP